MLRSGVHKGAMVRAARCLLAAVTQVLLLADTVVVKQLLQAKDKVKFTFSIIRYLIHSIIQIYLMNCFLYFLIDFNCNYKCLVVMQVSNTLTRLEGVNNFTEFVKAFSQFGSEMVDFAHVTGDRQNDLKDERRQAQMSAARVILERSTLMLLTASKVIRFFLNYYSVIRFCRFIWL